MMDVLCATHLILHLFCLRIVFIQSLCKLFQLTTIHSILPSIPISLLVPCSTPDIPREAHLPLWETGLDGVVHDYSVH